MSIHVQDTDLQTYRTAITVTDDRSVCEVLAGVSVLSETGSAILTVEYDTTIHNNGHLTAWQDFGVRLDGPHGWLVNSTGGVIEGRGGVHTLSAYSVTNLGRIVSNSDEVAAIVVGGGSKVDTVHVVNLGSLEGSRAIHSDGVGVALINSGEIGGTITLGRAADTIRSSGTIDGDVKLGGGNDHFDGRGGGAVAINGGGGRDVIVGGEGDDVLVGGRGRDKVYGGEGDDTLIGCYGKDVLEGGGGSDTFVFLNTRGVDRIKDFAVGEDRIHLDNAVFAKLGAEGGLAADAFRVGARAEDGDDRVIYDATTGVLKYDANGDAAGGVVKIAKLAPGLDLTHGHFDIV